MGHGDTSCDPHLHQTVEQPTLHYLTRSVRRRAAWFKSRYRRSSSHYSHVKATRLLKCRTICRKSSRLQTWRLVSLKVRIISSKEQGLQAVGLVEYFTRHSF